MCEGLADVCYKMLCKMEPYYCCALLDVWREVDFYCSLCPGNYNFSCNTDFRI